MVRKESVAKIQETRFVRGLLEDPVARTDLFGIKGMPNAPIAFQDVPYPLGEGDVDILFCAEHQPEVAAAVQVKVIRFAKELAFEGIRPPNGLSNLAEGVQQANETLDLGFARTYLYVFVAVDARERNAGKGITFEGLPFERDRELHECIGQVARTSGLDPRVILVRFDFQQVTPTTARGRTHLIAPDPIPDAPTVQPPQLTEWVACRLVERPKYEVRQLNEGGLLL